VDFGYQIDVGIRRFRATGERTVQTQMTMPAAFSSGACSRSFVITEPKSGGKALNAPPFRVCLQQVPTAAQITFWVTTAVVAMSGGFRCLEGSAGRNRRIQAESL
jgi:hypothetical protein